MTVYIDILFLENFILNFIILYATGLISKHKIKFIKIALGSIVGAVYVIITYLIENKVYLNILFKLILSIVIVYIAFTPKTIKEMLKMIVLFYLTSFVFGGAALGVIYMINSGKISIQNGIIIGSYTLRTIFIGAIIAFAVTILAFKFVKTKISKKDLLCNITIKINGKEIKTKAMIDTGNMLKEPITNIPVVVVEHTLLKEIIPKEILENMDNILAGDFKEIPEEIQNEYMLKLKVIPFTSLGKQNGMLLGVKAESLKVEEEDNIKDINKVIIGMYNKKLSRKNEYSALLGLEAVNGDVLF